MEVSGDGSRVGFGQMHGDHVTLVYHQSRLIISPCDFSSFMRKAQTKRLSAIECWLPIGIVVVESGTSAIIENDF